MRSIELFASEVMPHYRGAPAATVPPRVSIE
jgi:hypothetical protein